MSLKSRFRIFIALAMVGPIIFSALWLTQERSRMLREKQEKAKNLVEAAYSLLAESYQLEQAGMPPLPGSWPFPVFRAACATAPG